MEMISAQDIINKRECGVLLDMNSIRQNMLMNKALLIDPNLWHAFVVHSRKPMSRNEVLKMIFDYIYPLDLIPLKFETLGRGGDYIFLSKNCSEAIQKLCSNNLVIPNTEDPGNPLRCEIILQYAGYHEIQMKILDELKTVLNSLYNHRNNRTLNLDNFCENEGLSDYFPLSQPKILYYVLNASISYNPSVIKLRNNEIRSLNSLEILWKCSSLIQLDLRNNKIDDISSFKCLKDMKLTQIYLDGNPVCDNLDEYTYVTELKQIFPCLQKIDGVLISRDGAPPFKKNYLCNKEGFTIVNKFMETYFSLYDKDRTLLEDLYHPNALFSITNMYKTGQTTSNDARLRPYQINCRNLLAIADLSRSQQYMIKGNKIIIRKLNALPQVEHDPFSFMTDLMFYSEDVAIINVCGVFRETPMSVLDTDRYLGFTRSFVLKNCNGEYLISNDMFHVYNALSLQATKAFIVPRPILTCQLPSVKSLKDKEKAIETFEILTGLTKEWSVRLLEEAGFNITECIKSFMAMYKVDKIPMDAFKH